MTDKALKKAQSLASDIFKMQADRMRFFSKTGVDVFKNRYIFESEGAEKISLNLPLSVNIDDIRTQTLAVIRAHERKILINEDIKLLEKVVDLLDDILNKAINAKQQRDNNAK